MNILVLNGSPKPQGSTAAMRGMGRNLAWLLKCIAAGRAAGMEPPRAEELVSTNFIR